MIRDASRLLHGEITDKIIRAYYDVYDALTYGIPESAFRRALHIALRDLGVNFETEVHLPVYFRGELVGKYRADLIVENKVIVEIKTAPRIVEAHTDQLSGYLKISQLQVGLVINFGPKIEFERFFRRPGNNPLNPLLDSTNANLSHTAAVSAKSVVSGKSEGS